MTKIYSTNNSILKPFFDELNKYADGVHILNDGVSDYAITQLESCLDIKLPIMYIEFLRICNGGELFATPAGTEISEVYDSSKGPMREKVSYVNQSYMPEHRWPEMPLEYLIIADTNYGDPICIDLSTSDGNDAEIVQWSHEVGEVSRRWSSLIGWLMAELEEGSMIVNYDGSLKE